MGRLAFSCLMISALLLGACAEPNSDVPAGPLHAMDGSYLDGSRHGPDAKLDLTRCQACHGERGGPGDNPLFNKGIESAGDMGCEACHGSGYAHPRDWAGPNNTFHYSAGNVQVACTLCHGVNLDGVGGVGASCLGCHDSVTAFTLDCAFCHGYPPDGTPDVATATGVDHTDVPLDNHFECTFCHGMSQSEEGGGFEPLPNYNLFDKGADNIGDHWDSNIQMTAEAGYNDSTYGCQLTFCHASDTEAPMSDSGLPVVLKNMY